MAILAILPTFSLNYVAFNRPARQNVGAFVHDVAVVAAHPVPGEFVTGARCIQLLPQVGIFDFFIGFGFPAMDPFGDAVFDVATIGV